MADIPAGTGLGSSGSFTTALLKALHTHQKNLVHPRELAEQACHIEIDLLKRADRQAGPVHRRLRRPDLLPVPARRPRRGLAAARSTPRRSTTSRTTCCCSSPATAARPRRILKEQDDAQPGSDDRTMVDNLHFVKDLGLREPGGARGRRPARASRELMNVHWEQQEAAQRRHEQRRHRRLVRPGHGERRARRQADRRRRRRLPDVLRRGQGAAAPRAWRETGLREVRFRFDFEGTKVVDPVTVARPTCRSAILAGGLATRLRPLTETVPKALVTVAGRPFIDHQLALLRAAGRAARGALRRAPRRADRGARRRRRARSASRVALLATTASGCWAPAARCGGRCRCWATPSACCTATRYLDIDYAAVLARASRAPARWALMTVLRNEGRWDRSNVAVRGRPARRATTSGADAGHAPHRLRRRRCCAARRWTACRPDEPFDLADLYRDLVGRGTHGRLRGDASGSTRSARPRAGGNAGHLAGARRTERQEHVMSYTDRVPRRGRRRSWTASTAPPSTRVVDAARRARASAAAACSSWASAAAPATPRTRSTTSARSRGIEAYAPTDNVSELTARINDEGWETVFADWLRGSRLGREGRGPRLLGRRRRPRAEHQPQPRARRSSTRSRSGATDLRHRRPRRRLHGAGGRRLRDRPDRQRRARHARTPRRSRRWSGTCSSRIPRCRPRRRSGSRRADGPPRGLPRPRRRAEPHGGARRRARIRRRPLGRLECCRACPRPAAARRPRAAAHRGHQPARRGPRRRRPATRSRRINAAPPARAAARLAIFTCYPRRRATAAPAASRGRACCARRPRRTTSTCGAASWSATAGATSPRARPRAARRSCSTRPTASASAARPTTTSPTSAGRAGGSSRLVAAPADEEHRMTRRHPATRLRVKIFADGADKAGMLEMAAPALHRRLHHQPHADAQGRRRRLRGVRPRRAAAISDRPISFEVFSDEFAGDGAAGAGDRVLGPERLREDPRHQHLGTPSLDLIRRLAAAGIQLNVTALMTLEQVRDVSDALADGPSLISVFAGRIADTGRDPVPLMPRAVEMMRPRPDPAADLGQPPRAAEHLPGGRHRLPRHHGDERHPEEADPGRQGPGPLSLDTVRMFLRDARAAGYTI